MRALAIVCLASGVLGCDPPTVNPPEDAGTDGADGGCTARPGELLGERRIAAGVGLPDLMLETPEGPVPLTRFHTPCEGRVIVLRSLTAWSGPSLWHVAHTGRLTSEPRATVIDLFTEDEDAEPTSIAALARVAPRYDVAPAALVADPEDRLATLALGGIRLPLVAIVDARDLRVMRVLFAPHAGQVEHAIVAALAAIDGRTVPPAPTLPLYDERFAEDSWDLITQMRWAPPPPDPSNAVADDVAAAGLGATFFEDAGLSPEGVGCVSCHDPALDFVDGLTTGMGIGVVRRNTPHLYGAAHSRWPFWDGRVDSLWAQALGPIESPLEMGSSRLFVAHRVAEAHARGYERLFGALPPLDDGARFPPEGGPGDPAWDAMTESDRDAVTRVVVNVGKAIAAFERTIAPPRTAFDRYAAGEIDALTATERDGLLRFVENGCIQCHHGPTLSDDAFHNIGMPGSELLDRGRADVLSALTESPFRRFGPYSDDPGGVDPLTGLTAFGPRAVGSYRTPGLRGVARTAPYGHGGALATIREVVEHYANVRNEPLADPRVEGELDPHVPAFEATPGQLDPLEAFLATL